MNTRKTTSELQLLPQDPLAANVGRDGKKEEKAQACFHWGQEQCSLGCRQWWDQEVTKATVLGIRHRHDAVLPSQKVQSWLPSSHPRPISPHDIQPVAYPTIPLSLFLPTLYQGTLTGIVSLPSCPHSPIHAIS